MKSNLSEDKLRIRKSSYDWVNLILKKAISSSIPINVFGFFFS